jgi:hypothetical protein
VRSVLLPRMRNCARVRELRHYGPGKPVRPATGLELGLPKLNDHDMRQVLLRRLAEQPSGDLISRLCCLATTTIPCDDAVVVLEAMFDINGPLASCHEIGAQLANTEFELGEGPSFVIRETGRFQLTADLAGRLPPMWPVLGAWCQEMGVLAVASYPLQVGHAQLGALHAVLTSEQSVEPTGHASALAIADLLTDALLYMQSGLTEMDFVQLLATSDSDRLRVHQATGMTAEMLSCSVADAMAVMRARAFESDITLYELSRRIVNREMRIEP